MLACDNLLYDARKFGVTVTTDDELATADVVGGQLIRLMRCMERSYAQYQAEHPEAVERPTYLLLVHLVKDGPQRTGTLAEAVRSDPSTVSRQIAHLVKLGLVERTADPEDGRAALLAASEKGRRVFEENKRLRTERIAALLAHWTPDDRHLLADLLSRLTAEFENARTTPGSRLPAQARA